MAKPNTARRYQFPLILVCTLVHGLRDPSSFGILGRHGLGKVGSGQIKDRRKTASLQRDRDSSCGTGSLPPRRRNGTTERHEGRWSPPLAKTTFGSVWLRCERNSYWSFRRKITSILGRVFQLRDSGCNEFTKGHLTAEVNDSLGAMISTRAMFHDHRTLEIILGSASVCHIIAKMIGPWVQTRDDEIERHWSRETWLIRIIS